MLHRQRVIYSFQTTTEAMKMEQLCKALNVPGRIIPIPSQISAGCGLAWAVDFQQAEQVDRLIEEHTIVLNSRDVLFI